MSGGVRMVVMLIHDGLIPIREYADSVYLR